MATKEMIEKLRMKKNVYTDNQGRLPKHYLEWLENAVADHFYFNCNYCKKREKCQDFARLGNNENKNSKVTIVWREGRICRP